MIKAFAIAAALTLTAASAQAAQVGIRNESGSSHRSYTHGQSDYSYQGSSQFGSETSTSTSDTRRTGFGQVADDIIIRDTASNVTITGAPGSFDDVLVNGDADITLRSAPTRTRTANGTTTSWERGSSSYNGSESSRFSGGESSTFSESSVFAR